MKMKNIMFGVTAFIAATLISHVDFVAFYGDTKRRYREAQNLVKQYCNQSNLADDLIQMRKEGIKNDEVAENEIAMEK